MSDQWGFPGIFIVFTHTIVAEVALEHSVMYPDNMITTVREALD
jgi:hypothetical protein